MIIETLKNEIFINSLDELVMLNLRDLRIPFTFGETTNHELITLLINYIHDNYLNAKNENLEILSEKIKRLNKNFDEFMKTIKEQQNDKMIWIEFENKVYN